MFNKIAVSYYSGCLINHYFVKERQGGTVNKRVNESFHPKQTLSLEGLSSLFVKRILNVLKVYCLEDNVAIYLKCFV